MRLKKNEVNHIEAARCDERTNDQPPSGKQNRIIVRKWGCQGSEEQSWKLLLEVRSQVGRHSEPLGIGESLAHLSWHTGAAASRLFVPKELRCALHKGQAVPLPHRLPRWCWGWQCAVALGRVSIPWALTPALRERLLRWAARCCAHKTPTFGVREIREMCHAGGLLCSTFCFPSLC